MAKRLTGASVMSVPPRLRDEDDAGQGKGQKRGAGVVDVDLLGPCCGRSVDADDDERQKAERQVDEEDPAPGEIIDEEAADQRTEHGREAEHAAEKSPIAAALAWRDDIADDGDGRDDEAAAAQALQDAKGDQLRQVLGETAEGGADKEDRDGHLQHDAPAEDVAELAVEREPRWSWTADRPSRSRTDARGRRCRSRWWGARSIRWSGRGRPAAEPARGRRTWPAAPASKARGLPRSGGTCLACRSRLPVRTLCLPGGGLRYAPPSRPTL